MTGLKLDEEHRYRFWTDVFTGTPIHVEGKDHYKKLMAQGGFVPFEKAQEIAYEAKRKHGRKDYKPDPALIHFLRNIQATADRHGNVQLGSRAIAKMKEFGVNFDAYMPNYLKDQRLEDVMEGGLA